MLSRIGTTSLSFVKLSRRRVSKHPQKASRVSWSAFSRKRYRAAREARSTDSEPTPADVTRPRSSGIRRESMEKNESRWRKYS